MAWKVADQEGIFGFSEYERQLLCGCLYIALALHSKEDSVFSSLKDILDTLEVS